MNLDRYGENQEYATDLVGNGMTMNVFYRVFELKRNFDQMRSSIRKLKKAQREWDNKNPREVARLALTGIKRLMRSLDSFEYAFPELGREIWFSGFQDDVYHAYWRVEDGEFVDAPSDEDTTKRLLIEVDGILSNISDSSYTNPIDQLERFIQHYGEEFDPFDAPDEYQNEVFEARDLYCLGYFSTGLIVLGRAVERALLHLGRERKITSVDGFRGQTDWEDARFFERAKSLYVVDMPEKSGKILSKRQFHQLQLLIDYRNQVAHNQYRHISKETASRMMGQALNLLFDLEERRNELEDFEDDQIQELENVSIPL